MRFLARDLQEFFWLHRNARVPRNPACKNSQLFGFELVDVVKAPAGANLGQGKPDHPDLFIFFTFASVASIDAANSRIAFARRSAASLASFLGVLRSLGAKRVIFA